MRTCSVPGCDKKHLARGFCARHHQQIIMGVAPYNPGRCVTDKNLIKIHGDFANVELYSKDGEVSAIALIDRSSVPLIEDMIWCYSGNGYARSMTNKVTMQDVIMCHSVDNFVVDHINRDGLDNRISNLRLASFSENNSNKGLSKKNSSGYIGVYHDKKRNVYNAYMNVNYKKVFYKSFNTAIEAAMARDDVAKKFFGRRAVLNFSGERNGRRPI